jgi:hypothetical protein
MMAGAAVMEGWFELWQHLCRRCRECWGSRDVFVPPWCRGGHKRADWRGGGTAMMAGAVAMERVALDKESARWSKEGRPGEAPIMVDG